jgi:LemA protein
MNSLTLVFSVIGLSVFYGVFAYNGFVKLKVMCENAWSDIDVHLKKRHDLIPNLVNTVKGYTTHESETLEGIIKARNHAIHSQGMGEQVVAENALSQMIPKFFALSESYPELKADTNFRQLSDNLSSIENDLSQARRYYNAVVRDFSQRTQTFPSNLVAKQFGFSAPDFFESSDSEKAVPKVEF